MSASYVIGYEKGLHQGTINGRWIQIRSFYKQYTGENLEDKIDQEIPKALKRAIENELK